MRKLGNRIAIRLMEGLWKVGGGGSTLFCRASACVTTPRNLCGGERVSLHFPAKNLAWLQSSKIGHETGPCRAIRYMAWLNQWYSCYAVPSLSISPFTSHR
jgi:hypothetical protein